MKILKNVSSGGVHEDPHQPMAYSLSWTCIDVILLYPGTVFYVADIMLIFQMDWFLIYLHFHLSAFWLEIAHFGPNLDIFGR